MDCIELLMLIDHMNEHLWIVYDLIIVREHWFEGQVTLYLIRRWLILLYIVM